LKQRAQGGNVAVGVQRVPMKYRKPPQNNANNDPHNGYQQARGSGDYSWGKVSPSFDSEGAEITPRGHNEVTRRKRSEESYLTPAQQRAYARGGRPRITPAPSIWRAKGTTPALGQGR
jgi:hypothetical protein